MSNYAIVSIPCFNEAERLQLGEFKRFLELSKHRLLFVDDGSTDGTYQALADFCERTPGAEVLRLPDNRGKAEAVRRGLLRSIAHGADIVGYADADLATPVDEILRLIDVISTRDVSAVIGSRIAFLGTEIERSWARHYLGRVFATAASLILGERVYDTQCGAKFFRTSHGLADALAVPFRSRWAFDVELLGRLWDSGATIIEVPLLRWIDVAGSKLRLKDMGRVGFDLARIALDARRRRKSTRPPGGEHP